MRVYVLLLLTAFASGSPTAAFAREDQMLTVDVDLVNIHFTVCTSKGKLIADLDRENFSVFEDGDPQVITHFSRETDVPFSVAILMDTSGSVRYKLGFEKDAAIAFLHSTLQYGTGRAALFTFDSTVELRQDYTDDSQLLADAVTRIRAGGGTRLYDALYSVLQQQWPSDDMRKAIVVITDGDDKSSRISPEQVVELAQRNNVAIYAVGTNAFEIRLRGADWSDQILDRLASETGGKAFFPAKPEKLPSEFQKIASELRSRYSLAYRPTNQNRDGTFRRIRIEARNGQYVVRTRSGYFASEKYRQSQSHSRAFLATDVVTERAADR